MKVIFTIHAKEKLRLIDSKSLGITRKSILGVLNKPLILNKNINPHQSIGVFSSDLSLVVAWKIEDGIIRVITFYPAKKGRYESKILRRR